MIVELSRFSPCTIHVRVESLKTFEMPPDEFGMRCKEGEREKKADRSPSHMTIALRGGAKTPKAEIESEAALISVMRFRIKGKQGITFSKDFVDVVNEWSPRQTDRPAKDPRTHRERDRVELVCSSELNKLRGRRSFQQVHSR